LTSSNTVLHPHSHTPTQTTHDVSMAQSRHDTKQISTAPTHRSNNSPNRYRGRCSPFGLPVGSRFAADTVLVTVKPVRVGLQDLTPTIGHKWAPILPDMGGYENVADWDGTASAGRLQGAPLHRGRQSKHRIQFSGRTPYRPAEDELRSVEWLRCHLVSSISPTRRASTPAHNGMGRATFSGTVSTDRVSL
jgi:hypothetical protein